jgi:predicted DsbA family dithiol-disulfide isomerase
MALRLTMFSDYVCPFCYIGFETVRRLKPEFDLRIEWRGFQIHPDWPAEGMPAERFYGSMDQQSRRAAWGRIEALANDIGLTMKPPSVLTNSRLALEATEFARESGHDESFEELVYRAYFFEGKNIADQKLLLELGEQSGLDRKALAEALDSGRYSLKLKNTALAANSRGVSGVPTFFIGEFPLVGAQSEDVMRQLLKRATERMAVADS